MCTPQTDGIFGYPNMGKHMKEYRFKKIKILVPSIIIDEDHISVGTLWQFVKSIS